MTIMYSCIQESLGGLSKCLPTRLLITAEKKPAFWHQFSLWSTQEKTHTRIHTVTQIICSSPLIKRMTGGRSTPISVLPRRVDDGAAVTTHTKTGTKSTSGKNGWLAHLLSLGFAVLWVVKAPSSVWKACLNSVKMPPSGARLEMSRRGHQILTPLCGASCPPAIRSISDLWPPGPETKRPTQLMSLHPTPLDEYCQFLRLMPSYGSHIQDGSLFIPNQSVHNMQALSITKFRHIIFS